MVNVFGQSESKKKENKKKLIETNSEGVNQEKENGSIKPKKNTPLEDIIYDVFLSSNGEENINLPGEIFDAYISNAAKDILSKIDEMGYCFSLKSNEVELKKNLESFRQFEENKQQILKKYTKDQLDYLCNLLTEIISVSDPKSDEDLTDFYFIEKEVGLYKKIKENDNRVIFNENKFTFYSILSTITNILTDIRIAAKIDTDTEELIGFQIYEPDKKKLAIDISSVQKELLESDKKTYSKEDILKILDRYSV